MKARFSVTASILLGSSWLLGAACNDTKEIIPAQCNVVDDCPGEDTPCRTRVCRGNACGIEDAADNTKLPAAQQLAGDCKEVVCDGKGGKRVQSLAAGSVCTEAGGNRCNTAGVCVVCLSDADCPGAACNDGACVPASCMDGAKNGKESDVDCGGMSCPHCDDGKACIIGDDCKSGACASNTCQAPKCGDGVRQGAEECDDGNATSGDGCTPGCKADILFTEDMESGAPGWTHVLLNSPNGGVSDLWHLTDARAASGVSSYHSGTSQLGEGDTRLISPMIDLTTLEPTAKVKLTFSELHHFDDCGDFDFDSDGAIIEVITGKTPFDAIEQIAPIGGYPDTLDDICGNPLANLPAFTHDTGGMFHVVEVDLTPYVGREIRLGFHVGWDCGNCILEEGFYLDDVRVEKLP